MLFVCVHNAGRSQMAAGLLADRAGDAVRVRSAGSAPADQLNPTVVETMREVGVDISRATPTLLADDAVREADVVVTMGCGDACPLYPGRRYLDWAVDDPAGRTPEDVRRIRDDIAARVEQLLADLGISARG